MLMKYCFRYSLLAVILAADFSVAHAQEFPTRPIVMVMPYAPGGPGDIITRLFVAAMQKTLGQQIVVENPAGASGSIGTAKVARARPDGYTLLMIHVSHATNLAMYRNLPYHPVDDFEPIGQAGVGSASHLCSLMFMNALNVSLTSVPYKGTAPALNDVFGGQLDVMCEQTTTAIPAMKGNRVKVYAVAGRNRLPSLPDLPAIGETGVAGFDINISFGLYAPKGTPKAVIDKLTAALQIAVRDPEVMSRLDGLGVSAVSPDRATPEVLRAHLKQEIETLGALLIKSGVKPD
jgi:tripartite-type tricarboxylate transporter receptor subunit TctC